MNQDYGFELGWGLYVIILPLIVSILLEWLVKPFVFNLESKLKQLNNKIKIQQVTIKFLKKWF